MINFNECIVCNSATISSTGYLVDGSYPLLHCDDCGLSFLDFGNEQIEKEFDDYWSDRNIKIYSEPSVIDELKNKYLKYFNKLENTKNKKLLDVGSGAGICVNTAQVCGFEAMGVEPSPNGVELARKSYSVNIVNGLLSIDDSLPRDFDVLTLWDVIEHVHDPNELISACAAHLSKSGYLILETPDEGILIRELVRRISKIHKKFELRNNMYYRAHRYYFNRTAMKELLNRCGFDEVRFYKERSMYQKAILKKRYFAGKTGNSELLYKTIFWFLERLPLAQNKMVLIAKKAG